MVETGVALHRGFPDAPCSYVPQRNLGRPQGYSWVLIGENILSRCTNDVNRLAIRASFYVDDFSLRLAGSHMTRFASWCEREEVHVGSQSGRPHWVYLRHAPVVAMPASLTLFVL